MRTNEPFSKHLLFAARLTLIGSVTMSLNAYGDEETVRGAIRERMPSAEIRSITRSPIGSLYEVVVNGSQVFYVDEKGETAFFGKLVDLRTRADLTQARTQDLMVVDFASLPLDKAIVTSKGNGSRKLVVFSDPDCPFCKQLEKTLEGINNITIYTFLYPLASLHPDATRKAEIIWCAPDRAKVYRDWMIEGVAPAGERDCATPVADIVKLAKSLWIQGTPGIVFANGRLVPGAMQRHQIEAMLDAASNGQATSR